MSEIILSAARELVGEVRRQLDAEVLVAFDALTQAGWPSTRMVQMTEQVPGGGFRVTLSLARGIEIPDDLPVFVAEWGFRGGLVAGTERTIVVTGTWLVTPIPTPHPTTIERGNIEAAQAAKWSEPTWCNGCEREISDDTCHCGDYFKDHGGWDSHAPVPMGCVCHLKDASP